jgi:autotransporter family porin
MPAHAKTRATSRVWKFILRCPADKMPLAQETIRSRFLDFVKLRKGGELKEHIEKFDVVFAADPDEGGLAVTTGEATLIHRTSVDRVSYPKLRGAIVDATQLSKDSVHLEETKIAKAPREVKAAPPPPAPIAPEPLAPATMIEQINTMVAEPVRPPPIVLPPPPVEIGVLLPIEPPAPPMPKKSRQAINKATRSARPPPIDVAPPPQQQPSPPLPPPTPAPAMTPSQRVFGYTYPKAAPTPTPAIVFGFRK